DFTERSLVCVAHVPQGGLAWFMDGDDASVLAATDAACHDALAALDARPPLGLVAFDCIARRGVLGEGGLRTEVDRIASYAGGAPERAAEAVEAEVAAIVRDGAVRASVGFRAGHVPVGALVALATGGGTPDRDGRPAVLPVPGAGDCAVVAVPIDATTTLVVARSGEPF